MTNNKGLTLVELVVTMALLTITLAAILSIVLPAINIYHETNLNVDAENVAEILTYDVAEEIRFINNAIVVQNVNGVVNNMYCVYSDGGKIYTSDPMRGPQIKGLASDSLYDEFDVELVVESVVSSTVKFRINVSINGKEVSSLGESVNMLNHPDNLMSGKAEITVADANANGICYKLS